MVGNSTILKALAKGLTTRVLLRLAGVVQASNKVREMLKMRTSNTCLKQPRGTFRKRKSRHFLMGAGARLPFVRAPKYLLQKSRGSD